MANITQIKKNWDLYIVHYVVTEGITVQMSQSYYYHNIRQNASDVAGR